MCDAKSVAVRNARKAEKDAEDAQTENDAASSSDNEFCSVVGVFVVARITFAISN